MNCEKMYYGVKKKTKYLYEITYKDYREDENLELIEYSPTSGCSSVRNRNFYGRNFDFTYNDIPEFIGNNMVVKEKFGKDQVMTNYYCNLKNLTEHAEGVERAEILKENYKEGSTLCGMRKLLQRVRYSNVYRFDNEKEFYSEFATQSQIKNKGSKEWIELMKLVDKGKKDYWILRAENRRYPSKKENWFTTHNSTYDIDRRFLRISVQENYGKYFDFYLSDF